MSAALDGLAQVQPGEHVISCQVDASGKYRIIVIRSGSAPAEPGEESRRIAELLEDEAAQYRKDSSRAMGRHR